MSCFFRAGRGQAQGQRQGERPSWPVPLASNSPRPPSDAGSLPRLQVWGFGDGLVEAASAHKPVRFLRALALGRYRGGEDLGGLG